MKIGNFEINIASLPERDDLIAEIYHKNEHWAVIFEEVPMTVYFYSKENCDYWEFSLDEAMEVLEKAKNRLMDLGKKRD